MSPTTRSRGAGDVASSPLRALFDIDNGSTFLAGVLFASLVTTYSDEWTPGQREHFLDVIDREIPDVTARTVTYVGLLEGGRR